jgi:predicted protein tyrosine phosphatase
MSTTPTILITNIEEAAVLALEFDAVITAGPAAYEVGAPFDHPDHLVVEFDDEIRRDWGGPTRADIRAILDFARERRDRSILVHCHAGMSRSTAVAIAILHDRGLPEADAFTAARAARPMDAIADERPFIPNPLVLAHADAILGGALVDHDPDLAFDLATADPDAWESTWTDPGTER